MKKMKFIVRITYLLANSRVSRILEEMEGRCYHTGRRGKDDGG
jgi:hypothetical protein